MTETRLWIGGRIRINSSLAERPSVWGTKPLVKKIVPFQVIRIVLHQLHAYLTTSMFNFMLQKGTSTWISCSFLVRHQTFNSFLPWKCFEILFCVTNYEYLGRHLPRYVCKYPWSTGSHFFFHTKVWIAIACEQALLFGRAKWVSGERASERRSLNRRACSKARIARMWPVVN